MSIKHKSVTVKVRGIEVTCSDVEFWPYVPATEIDPPEPPIVDWNQAFIGGVDVDELFMSKLGEELEDALIKELEG